MPGLCGISVYHIATSSDMFALNVTVLPSQNNAFFFSKQTLATLWDFYVTLTNVNGNAPMQGFCEFVKLRVCDSHRRCVVLGFAGREAPVGFGGTQRAALIWINSAIKHQAMAQKCCSPASPRTPPTPFHCFRSNRGEKRVGRNK